MNSVYILLFRKTVSQKESLMKSSNERESDIYIYIYKRERELFFSVSLIIWYTLIFLPLTWPILRHVRGRKHVPPHCLLLFCFFFGFSMYSLFKTTLFEALNLDISCKGDSNFCSLCYDKWIASVGLNFPWL